MLFAAADAVARFGDAKRGRSPLDQPSLGEAGDVAAGDDQVIEHSDVDERQRFAQAPRDEFMFKDER